MITVTGTRENYIAEMTADRGTLNATHCLFRWSRADRTPICVPARPCSPPWAPA